MQGSTGELSRRVVKHTERLFSWKTFFSYKRSTLQGTITYPTKREVRKIISSKVPAGRRIWDSFSGGVPPRNLTYRYQKYSKMMVWSCISFQIMAAILDINSFIFWGKERSSNRKLGWFCRLFQVMDRDLAIEEVRYTIFQDDERWVFSRKCCKRYESKIWTKICKKKICQQNLQFFVSFSLFFF